MGLLHLTNGRVGEPTGRAGRVDRADETPAPTNPNYGYLTWLGTEYTRVPALQPQVRTRAYHSEPFAVPDMVYFDGFGGARVYVSRSRGLVIVRTGRIAPRLGRRLPAQHDYSGLRN